MKKIGAKISNYISIVVFAVITILLFSPFVMYVTNIDELWFKMSAFMPAFCFVALLAVLVVTAFLGLLPKGVASIFATLGFAIGICTYIQGQILKNDYGTLDGHDIDWSQYTKTAILNTCLWLGIIIVLLVLYVKYKDKMIRAINTASLVFLAYEALMCGLLVLQNREKLFESEKTYLTSEGLYEVSAKDNVIVILLDEFQADVFNKVLDEYPEVYQMLDGFRYYPDTVGGAARTMYAIPYILTGQVYSEPVTYQEYRDKSFQNSALIKRLEKSDVASAIFSDREYVGRSVPKAVDNAIEDGIQITSHRGLAKDFFKLNCFRIFPHIAKKYVWLHTAEFDKYVSDDTYVVFNQADFYKGLINNRLTTNNKDKCFRFIHLFGDHAPYLIDEKGNELPEGERSTAIIAGRGCLAYADEYLNQLKSLGVYDDAFIVIMADHGGENKGNPIFMVKPKKASGTLQISDKPMHYSCIQQMLVDAIDGSNQYPDEYISTPERRFTYYKQKEYEYIGVAYDNPTVVETGVDYSMQAGNNKEYNKYKLGTELDFREKMNGLYYVSEGMNTPEFDSTPTCGDRTVFTFDISGKVRDMQLILQAGDMQEHGEQPIRLLVNDNILYDEIYADDLDRITVVIPKEIVPDGKIRLVIEHPEDELSMWYMIIDKY